MGSIKSLFYKIFLAAAVSVALGLTGCGGGGDSETSTFLGTASGKAAKGIIKNGLVTAQELDTSGTVVNTFDPVLTDENGEYSLVIGEGYGNGPILLTISPNTDSAAPTQMKCDVAPECGGTGGTDAPDFGEWMDVDPDFEMQAILPAAENGEEVSAQITPFTHMAASRALNDTNGVSASSVNAAISEVNQIVGVPIMNVVPVDITDQVAVANASADDLVYATFTAGLGELLFSSDDGLVGGLDDLAATFSDGDIDTDDAIAISDLTDAVIEQASQLETTYPEVDLDEAIADINTTVLVIESSIGDDGSYDPEPTDSANLSAVEQAKALMSETRTLITSLEALESPADAFAGDLELASDVVDGNSQALFEILGMALEAAFSELDTQSIAGTLDVGTFTVPVVDGNTGESIGNVTVVLSGSNGLALSISGANLNGVDMSLNLTTNIPAVAALAGQQFVLNSGDLSISGSVENAEASISLNETALMLSVAQAVSIDPDTGLTDPVEPQVTGVELTGGITIQDKTSSTSFTGNARVNLVALGTSSADDPNDPNPISLSNISLDGEFADSSNSFSASVGLTINNAATFDTIALLDHEPEMWVYDIVMGDIFDAQTYALNEFGISNLQYAYYASWSNETCYSGYDASFTYMNSCIPGDQVDVAGFIMDQNTGAIAVDEPWFNYWSGNTEIGGEVRFPDFETADNYADVTLTASLDLELNGHPDTRVVISVNRTELEGGDATLTFTHDGHSISVEVDKPDGADALGSVTVTNPDGVELVLTGLSESDGGVDGALAVNGDQVGTVTETDEGLVIVRYDDGTFESLN